MAKAPDEHHDSESYHHMAGTPKRAHEGSQSNAPGKETNDGHNVVNPHKGSGGPSNDEAY